VKDRQDYPALTNMTQSTSPQTRSAKHTVQRVVRWLVVLAMPFFLGFTMIGLIVNDWYPRWAYNQPSVPPDRFGFTPEERLDLALVAVDYLKQPEPAEQVIWMLEQQRLPGTDQPLYNQRELDHMIDVKHLTDSISRLNSLAAFLVAAGLVFLLVWPETRPQGYKALMHGGIATVVVLLSIAAFIFLGWDIFFRLFHEVLFPPDSWSFAYTESLIRLFPEMFWFNLGAILSLGTLLLGIIAATAGYLLLRRRTVQPAASNRRRPVAES
jgi:integral membrane protein (TIGR01906 family)